MPYTVSVQARNQIVNVASVRHLSPFRYPGGKTWLVPHVREWLLNGVSKPNTFIEPFAGGGIVGLTVAQEGLAEAVVFAEKDRAVAAVWQTMLHRNAGWLAREILQFKVSRESVILRLATPARSRRELAFQTILRNRVQRGGILAPGASLMLNGENGRGVASRWYPETLAERVRVVNAMSQRIEFRHGDAFEIINEYVGDSSVAWFIDPPYTAGGKRAGSRLYTHTDLDHSHLFALMASVSGRVMLTYDEAPEVRALAMLHGFQINAVPMKNTHHKIMNELVITKEATSSLQRQREGVAITFANELAKRKRVIDSEPAALFPM
jgi:DNA adenine methylase